MGDRRRPHRRPGAPGRRSRCRCPRPWAPGRGSEGRTPPPPLGVSDVKCHPGQRFPDHRDCNPRLQKLWHRQTKVADPHPNKAPLKRRWWLGVDGLTSNWDNPRGKKCIYAKKMVFNFLNRGEKNAEHVKKGNLKNRIDKTGKCTCFFAPPWIHHALWCLPCGGFRCSRLSLGPTHVLGFFASGLTSRLGGRLCVASLCWGRRNHLRGARPRNDINILVKFCVKAPRHGV